jgi:hypothetical protein
MSDTKADPKAVLEFAKKNEAKILDLRFTIFPDSGTTFPIPWTSSRKRHLDSFQAITHSAPT